MSIFFAISYRQNIDMKSDIAHHYYIGNVSRYFAGGSELYLPCMVLLVYLHKGQVTLLLDHPALNAL